MPESSSAEVLFVTTAIKAWDVWQTRATKLFDSLTDEEMLIEIFPGKNRPVYLLGHLIAVNDGLIPQLRLGEPNFPEYRDLFITKPDHAVPDSELPSIATLRQNWKDVHQQIAELFAKLTPGEWLERHSTISEEDFAKEPHRNRLSLLLSRTSHISYHFGQLVLRTK